MVRFPSIGKLIEVKTYQPVDGRKEFEAVLTYGDDDRITIEQDGNSIEIDRSNLAKARLCYVEKED